MSSSPSSSTASHLFQNPVDPQDKQKEARIHPYFTPVVTLKASVSAVFANNLGLEVTVKHLDDVYQL